MEIEKQESANLLGGLLQVSNKIFSFLSLFETNEHHLGAWDVLFGIFQVLEQSIVVPGDALLLVGVSVVEAGSLASFAANETVQVGASLVSATLLHGVTLGASLHENLLSFLGVTGHGWS